MWKDDIYVFIKYIILAFSQESWYTQKKILSGKVSDECLPLKMILVKKNLIKQIYG